MRHRVAQIDRTGDTNRETLLSRRLSSRPDSSGRLHRVGKHGQEPLAMLRPERFMAEVAHIADLICSR